MKITAIFISTVGNPSGYAEGHCKVYADFLLHGCWIAPNACIVEGSALDS